MTANTVPGETLIQIFNYLKRDELVHVMHVCRRWRVFAGVRFFRELRVRHQRERYFYHPAFTDVVEDSAHVKKIILEIRSTEEVPRAEVIPRIIKSIQPFHNVRSFIYDDTRLGYLDASPWSVLWKVLDHVIISMPFLVSLSIHHALTNHGWRVYGSCDGWTGPDKLPRRLPDLKEIDITLMIDGTNAKAVDRFFMRLFATFDDAENLISDVELHWTSRNFEDYNSKARRFPYIWKLRNIKRLETTTDPEKSNLPADLILVDFSKLTVSTRDLQSFSILSSQLATRRRTSGDSGSSSILANFENTATI
ncbi:hypothetical protein TWF970_004824 [Orbilia oligospora]|uniref:F-box domain-containing protein n=1 Tax=Orbilia oligospora TaxID=2813651 RepID=A0A7C8V621_ORBOL|nr:hypothetical protein TWF970_004824 [Orbilia oligospora]